MGWFAECSEAFPASQLHPTTGCPCPFCLETSPLESLLSNKWSLIFMCVTQEGCIRGLALITQIKYYIYLKLQAIEALGTIQARGRFGLDAGEKLLQAWPQVQVTMTKP